MYIRDSTEVIRQGLFFDLHAYDYQVYGEFFEVHEEAGTHFRELCQQLDGRGVPDIFLEMRSCILVPFINALQSLMAPSILNEVYKITSHYQTGSGKNIYIGYYS